MTVVLPERLPPISAALILQAVGMEVFRDQFGMRQCLERGIGRVRKKMGPLPPGPLRFVPPLAEQEHEMTLAEAMEIARDEARAVLRGMCKACPFDNCKMKDWGDITP